MRHAVTLATALTSLAAAAPARASDDSQAWETLNVAVALPSNFKISNDTVVRTSDARGLYEVEDNLMLGYQANPHVSVWLGYTHDPQYLHSRFAVMEQRFRQQVNFDNIAKLGPVSLSGRIRVEERWREGFSGTGWRIRPGARLSVPFVGKTKLVMNHESFINFNTTGFQKQSGYERMRNSVGLNLPLGKRLSVDVGYLNQYGFVRGGPDTSDHALNTGLNLSF